MAVTIDYGNTNKITIPKADLTLVSGTLYSLDTNAFRLELKSIEDSELGVPFVKTHLHNTEVTVGGITYARTVEILAPYSIEFEDGAYSVRLEGSNNNIWDIEAGILVQNQVQVIPTNSAGLQIVSVGSGLTTPQATQLSEVWTILGLDIANKLIVSDVLRSAGSISQSISEVADTIEVQRL